MRIDTKYDLGATVYVIANAQAKAWEPCDFCGESGRIVGANDEGRSCPECYGRRGRDVWLPTAWRSYGARTVGQVRVQIIDSPGCAGADLFKPQKTRDEEYMLVETGIGSGTVWKVEQLFATAEDAAAACEALNAEAVKT